MPVQSDQAVVLRLSDYSETSQIATLFTRAGGLVRLLAKGARRGSTKRPAVGLDVLEYGEVGYTVPRGGSGLGNLTEWVQRDAFLGLRGELVRLYGGLYVAELVTALTEELDPHPELFAALLRTLSGLSQGGATVRLLAVFQAELLAAIGYAPNLSACVSCGRPRVRGRPAYFSASAGGLLCRDCEMHYVEKRRLPPNLLDTSPATGEPRAWFALLAYHLQYLAGRPFHTAGRLRAALGLPK